MLGLLLVLGMGRCTEAPAHLVRGQRQPVFIYLLPTTYLRALNLASLAGPLTTAREDPRQPTSNLQPALFLAPLHSHLHSHPQ